MNEINVKIVNGYSGEDCNVDIPLQATLNEVITQLIDCGFLLKDSPNKHNVLYNKDVDGGINACNAYRDRECTIESIGWNNGQVFIAMYETRIFKTTDENNLVTRVDALTEKVIKIEDSVNEINNAIRAVTDNSFPFRNRIFSRIVEPENTDTIIFGGLKWYILSYKDNVALLLCQHCIGKHKFISSSRKSLLSWKESYIRKLLNEDFWDKTFNAEEKNMIVEHENDRDLLDKVFILSVDEYHELKNIIDKLPLEGEWWLRPNAAVFSFDKTYFYCGKYGTVFYEHDYDEYYYVRPAIYIKIPNNIET